MSSCVTFINLIDDMAGEETLADITFGVEWILTDTELTLQLRIKQQIILKMVFTLK